MYARFFDNFKDRSLEDLKEMDKKRTWDIDLRNIKFFNNFEEKDPFVRFNIGWDFELRKIKEKGPRKKDKNGKLLPRRYKWVQTGTMGYEWYTNDVSNVARGKLAEYHTSWKFTARRAWSYFDLYDKKAMPRGVGQGNPSSQRVHRQGLDANDPACDERNGDASSCPEE